MMKGPMNGDARTRRRIWPAARPTLAAACLLALGCAATACSSAAPKPSPTTTNASRARRSWSLVALGDSVPRGTNCHCTPYPPLTAEDLSARSGRNVTADNDSVAGATTSGVLRQLESDSAVIGDVRDADVVEIEIGANDVGYSKTCGTTVECYAPRIPMIRTNLAAIVDRVHALAAGHKVLVVLLDYWSVWLGGRYAAAKGEAYVEAAATVTDEVDDIIKSTAARTGSDYVDLRAAFKGPNYTYDETHYLSSDGDHPNAAGHRRIATATDAVIEKSLHL
jgi:lysophospholipase L1-like esterase